MSVKRYYNFLCHELDKKKNVGKTLLQLPLSRVRQKRKMSVKRYYNSLCHELDKK
jgi:hypothetical protein